MTSRLPQSCQRQVNESARAYEGFLQYCELGPARSLARVSGTVGKNLKLIERWSSRHRWVHRVRGWDEWAQAHRIEKLVAEQEAMVIRHAIFGERALAVALAQLERLRRVKLSAAATARLARVGAAIEMEARGKPPEDNRIANVTIRIFEQQPDSES